MNEIAYDIAYLFELERQQAEAPAPPVTGAVPEVASRRAARPVVAEAQDALASELLQAAAVHEALVQQYLRMTGETFPEASGK